MAEAETAAPPDEVLDSTENNPVDPRQVLAGFTRNTPKNHPAYVRYDAEEKKFLDNAAIAHNAAGRSIEESYNLAARALRHRRELRREGLRMRRIVEEESQGEPT